MERKEMEAEAQRRLERERELERLKEDNERYHIHLPISTTSMRSAHPFTPLLTPRACCIDYQLARALISLYGAKQQLV